MEIVIQKNLALFLKCPTFDLKISNTSYNVLDREISMLAPPGTTSLLTLG